MTLGIFLPFGRKPEQELAVFRRSPGMLCARKQAGSLARSALPALPLHHKDAEKAAPAASATEETENGPPSRPEPDHQRPEARREKPPVTAGDAHRRRDRRKRTDSSNAPFCRKMLRQAGLKALGSGMPGSDVRQVKKADLSKNKQIVIFRGAVGDDTSENTYHDD